MSILWIGIQHFSLSDHSGKLHTFGETPFFQYGCLINLKFLAVKSPQSHQGENDALEDDDKQHG